MAMDNQLAFSTLASFTSLKLAFLGCLRRVGRDIWEGLGEEKRGRNKHSNYIIISKKVKEHLTVDMNTIVFGETLIRYVTQKIKFKNYLCEII